MCELTIFLFDAWFGVTLCTLLVLWFPRRKQ